MSKDGWIVDLRDEIDEYWRADIECEIKEEAIKLGTEMAKEEGIKSFWIGEQHSCGMSTIDTTVIIEDAQEQLYNNVGEAGDDYLENVTEEQQKELEEKLNDVFYEWHKKYNLFPTCYMVENSEKIEVN